MIRFRINHKDIEAEEGSTILQAAAANGIEIPSMCHLPGVQHQPSCMICMVKDLASSKLYPSCAMPASTGMDIMTDLPELHTIRKESLELLLSDHSGDCEAPCRIACPAFMDIPLMNRLIASGKMEEALTVVQQHIAIPLILGYICPAPCEKACKRRLVDGSVSICLLKRITALPAEGTYTRPLPTARKSGKRVAIIGTGPAGLSAAYYLLLNGHEAVLFDKEELPGGALRYSISDAELPREVLDAEIGYLESAGAVFHMKCPQNVAKLKANGFGNFDAYILATGHQHPVDEELTVLENSTHFVHRETFETSLPGVFACGGMIKELNMAVRAGYQGRMAAINAGRYLEGLPPTKQEFRFNSMTGLIRKEEFSEYLKDASAGERIQPTGGYIAGYTLDEAVREAKRCMHCDCRTPNSCKLRLYATLYGAERKRFAGQERLPVARVFQHDTIVYEPEKCIKCGICVEIASKEAEKIGLAFVGRGFDVRVRVPFSKPVAEALMKTALACASACPTGALAEISTEENLPGSDSRHQDDFKTGS